LDVETTGDEGAVTEGELVLGARKALRAGRAGEALELVARTRREFPSGALAQERDAIEVEALARSGASEEARDRARAFLTRYSGSPYAKNVEAVLRDAVPR
jgi:outer membrane protein assembly factor BamD (BamD/ComL family)